MNVSLVEGIEARTFIEMDRLNFPPKDFPIIRPLKDPERVIQNVMHGSLASI